MYQPVSANCEARVCDVQEDILFLRTHPFAGVLDLAAEDELVQNQVRLQFPQLVASAALERSGVGRQRSPGSQWA